MRYIIACLMFVSSAFGYEYKLSICAIFQNEAPYMKEWIEYHKLQGVEHFWLYNNESTDDWKTVVDPYIKEGSVEVFDWPNHWPHIAFPFGCQSYAYTDALNRARNKSTWLALIDLDEFILPLHEESIIDTLEKYFSSESGVYIPWLCFGTSNVYQLKPNQLMIEKMVMCAPASHPHNSFSKSIVKPICVTHCANPHLCQYKVGKHRDDNLVKEHFRINHYWCRDEWFFINTKIPRYIRWNVDVDTLLRLHDDMNKEMNLDIQRFVPRLAELYSDGSIH